LILNAPLIYLNPLRNNKYRHKNYTFENCDYIKYEIFIFNYNLIKKSKIFFEKYTDINIIIYDSIEYYF